MRMRWLIMATAFIVVLGCKPEEEKVKSDDAVEIDTKNIAGPRDTIAGFLKEEPILPVPKSSEILKTIPQIECKVTVEVRKGVVTARLTVHNIGDVAFRQPKWFFPYDGELTRRFFVVERNSKEVLYSCKMVSWIKPRPEHFVTIHPGENKSMDVNISECYDTTVAGTYRVLFNAHSSYESKGVSYSMLHLSNVAEFRIK